MLAAKSPELKKAGGVLKELSADERTRMIAEDCEKARRDEASRLNGAREEGKQKARLEVAKNALAKGLPLKMIHGITGLDLETIEKLKG